MKPVALAVSSSPYLACKLLSRTEILAQFLRHHGPHRVGCAEVHESNPAAPTNAMIDLGVVGRALSGGTAAVAVQWLVPLGNAEATLALAVTAGLTASPLIRTLRRQIVALANRQNKAHQAPHRSHRPTTDASDASKTNVRDFQRSA